MFVAPSKLWSHTCSLIIVRERTRPAFAIRYSSRLYSLLEYLMSNAGRVLSRTMIIEHVWDQSFDGVTNIVDVYVRHLRDKVDEGRDGNLIRTVRGVGYVISEEKRS